MGRLQAAIPMAPWFRIGSDAHGPHGLADKEIATL